MPEHDPDNQLSQHGISDTVMFLLAELYSNLIVPLQGRVNSTRGRAQKEPPQLDFTSILQPSRVQRISG